MITKPFCQNLKFGILLLLCTLTVWVSPVWTSPVQAESISLDWSSIGDAGTDIQVQRDGDVLQLLTTGNDPYFRFQFPKIPDVGQEWIVEWEYFCPRGIKHMEWRSGKRLHAPNAIELPALEPAEGWTSYRLELSQIDPEIIRSGGGVPVRMDLGSAANVKLQVRNIQVRTMTEDEKRLKSQREARRQAKVNLAHQIRQYYEAKWNAQITRVIEIEDKVVVEGTINNGRSTESLFIVPRSPQSVAAAEPTAAELANRIPVAIQSDGRFRVTSDSSESAFKMRDGTRFQLFQITADSTTAFSPAVYCEIESVAFPPAPKPLQNAKGLTCITSRFSIDQLRELGLEHASVNIMLDGIVDRAQHDGWTKAHVRGESWWVNEPKLQRLDGDIRTANDAGAVVAGILLVPTSKRGRSIISHPESSSDGTYAMPNLTASEPIDWYTATLHVLADRYGGSQPRHGRLDHWIVHNEIDYGWQWTNMGEQPEDVFIDHYVRSMRLVDAAVRRYNPHAKTFVSLTHRWNTQNNRHWKTYAPKSLLQRLVDDSRISGDFPWGVAYHPYPQSLWEADFWNDEKVSDDLDTELITVKNLQVLDRFMHLPTTRTADGSVRTVICSEQGYHADESDPEHLQRQAAALLLTWKKLRECPSIVAFDYHRPSDHPNEGGLRLGLRGLPTRKHRLGKPKPAWQVYSAINTEREEEMIRKYQNVWQN